MAKSRNTEALQFDSCIWVFGVCYILFFRFSGKNRLTAFFNSYTAGINSSSFFPQPGSAYPYLPRLLHNHLSNCRPTTQAIVNCNTNYSIFQEKTEVSFHFVLFDVCTVFLSLPVGLSRSHQLHTHTHTQPVHPAF